MASRVVAPVVEVRVRAGDRVRAGQVLLTLDDRDLSAHARQAVAAVAAAEQGLNAARAEQSAAAADEVLARAWHTRIDTLHARKSATSQELDEATARLAAAGARVEGARARIDQAASGAAAAGAAADAATTIRSYGVITAPFGGVVTERLVDPGSLATPGMPLLRLDSAGAARVEAQVDEARIAYVRAGDSVEVIFDGGEGGPTEGVVSEVARAVDTDTRAFTVKVALPEGYSARSGTFARIRFQGGKRSALVVPADAVRRQGQLASVFVVQDGVARMRLIQTGAEGAEGIEVLAGLDPDETVVVKPPAALGDGQRVGARP
jgi:RND family efflux transporter MFP subunit